MFNLVLVLLHTFLLVFATTVNSEKLYADFVALINGNVLSFNPKLPAQSKSYNKSYS